MSSADDLGLVEPFVSIAHFLRRLRDLSEPLPHVVPASDDGSGAGMTFEEQVGRVRACVSFDGEGCDFIVAGGGAGRCEHLTGTDAANELAEWRRVQAPGRSAKARA
jgi:hypothetical protein